MGWSEDDTTCGSHVKGARDSRLGVRQEMASTLRVHSISVRVANSSSTLSYLCHHKIHFTFILLTLTLLFNPHH